MFRRSIILGMLGISLLLFVTSCGRKPIHGQWRIISIGGFTDFSPEDYMAFDEVKNEYLVYSQRQGEDKSFYYLNTDTEPYTITITDKSKNNATDGICKIEGNKMTIKFPRGKKNTPTNFDVESGYEIWELVKK